jgi:hypothetical protein
MNELDLTHRFQNIMPSVVTWIDTTLEENRARAASVASLAFPRLGKVLPLDLLRRAKVVVVSGKVPFPPLTEMGIPEFKQMENMQMAGITYKDTFFLNQQYQTESLHFHELVHVVQWERLGVNNFLLAYGAGLMQFGYRESPFERMAYSLQTAFDRGGLLTNTIDLIQKDTDTIWNGLAPLFSKA